MQQPIVAAMHFTVHEGGLAEFRRQADAIRQQVDDTEEGVLFHAWYHDPASGEVTLLDIYRGGAGHAAGPAHGGRSGRDRRLRRPVARGARRPGRAAGDVRRSADGLHALAAKGHRKDAKDAKIHSIFASFASLW